MKKIFFLICLLLIMLSLPVTRTLAQSTDTAIAVVRFSFSHLMDTANLSDIYSSDMLLYIGKNASLFESPEKQAWDSAVKDFYAQNSGLPVTAKPPSKDAITNLYFKFSHNNNFFIVANLVKDYLIEDHPFINWKIFGDSSKQFGEISCQKAIGNFRGRTYVAWFAPSIPLSFGPWKLGGLPGLILEARDTKDQVIFKFAGLETLSRKSVVIQLPLKAITVTKNEFQKIEESVATDPFGYLKSTMGITLIGNTNFQPHAVPKSKNPLELTKD